MTMGPVQCTRFRFTLVKLQGLGMEAPEKQWGQASQLEASSSQGVGEAAFLEAKETREG